MVKRTLAALIAASWMTTAAAANVAPTVSVTGPGANAKFIGPANVTLSATAADSDGSINKVVFYNGTTVLTTVTVAPYTYNWASVAQGVYTVTAQATDNAGAVTTSAPLTVTVSPNALPTVAITAPATNSKYVGPATVPLSSTASDSDGNIVRVNYFYGGSNPIGSSVVAPYTVNWTNVVPGTYSVTARATDDKGGMTTSAPITVVVNPNVAPTVALTSPVSNAAFAAPGEITLTSSAADSDGSIGKVAYYEGTTLIGQATLPPYTLKWTGVSVGSHTITAKAFDDKGASTTSAPVSVVVNPNVAPTVSITGPANNASFIAGSNIALTSSSADTDGSVKTVAYFDNGALITKSSTAPFGVTWVGAGQGVHTVTAQATDDKGAVTTSAPITVTVKLNAAPTVSITAPAANASFAGPATIALTATASDSDGTIKRVDFYNGTTLIGGSATAPYTVTWSNVSPNSYSITAKATDDRNAVTTSAAVPLKVTGNVAPTVALTAPAAAGSYFAPSTISLSANASDTDGTIDKVEFYANGQLVGTASVAPYTYKWNVATGAVYSITAKAIDSAGGSTVSTPVQITVANNVAPVVKVAATPSQAALPATIAVTVTATDSDGSVAKVELYDGATLLTTLVQAPYTYSWTNASAGVHTITAKATDNLNAATTSAAATVTVTTDTAQVYYVYADQINTAREIVNAAGAKVWLADTEPFGANPPVDSPAGQGRFAYNLRFPGQYFDVETGLHYNYYRDYDPQIGRYIQSDPIGLRGGANTYAYVRGNPIRLSDPQGLNPYQPSPVSALENAIIEGNVAEVEALAEAAGLSDASAVARAAANANKIAHIFGNPAHKLEPLVKACGSRGKALGAMRTAAEKAAKGLGDGLVRRMTVTVNGVTIQVNGVVTNGTFLLGTGFIP